MLNAIAAGASSSSANPLLDAWVQTARDSDGRNVWALGAPYLLEFQIFDVSNDAKMQDPVQVWPTTPDARAIVNLTTDRVAGAPGHYAAAWTATTAARGRFQIRWYLQATSGAHEVAWTRDFDVLSAGIVPARGTSGYCTVSDLRDEGVTTALASDARLLGAIRLAGANIERYTGRFFEPRYVSTVLDGNGSGGVALGEPIIALDSVSFGDGLVGIEAGNFRTFNRHITEGLREPDDRAAPRIEFLGGGNAIVPYNGLSPLYNYAYTSGVFPFGTRNINVSGLFGYTDFDGSPMGETPLILRHAAKLMALREFRKLTDDEREDRDRWRLTSERTRDQSYTVQALEAGVFTGDREIDDILMGFCRPLRLGSA